VPVLGFWPRCCIAQTPARSALGLAQCGSTLGLAWAPFDANDAFVSTVRTGTGRVGPKVQQQRRIAEVFPLTLINENGVTSVEKKENS
jgi:hypothetical protein